MSEDHPTRRDLLAGLAAVPFLASSLEAQAAQQAATADSSLCFMSAVDMARMIRTKKLSAREALAAHLAQIERVNPKVNAIVTLVAEMATAAAAKADEQQARGETLGPLHGLPLTQKELAQGSAGDARHPHHFGIPFI
jgi:amidase